MESELLFIVDDPRDGPENMWIDREHLRRVEHARHPLTVIRFYQWNRPTVSLGRNQRPERAVQLEYCRRRSIPIVHRPSGGRAVYHADELTYALASNDVALFPISSIGHTYRVISSALRAGLQKLQVNAELEVHAAQFGRIRADERRKPCFMSPSRSELLCRGRKLVGSAQRRLKRSFLQHGSIPLTVNYREMSSVLGVEERVLRESMISLSEASERVVSFDLAARALRSGFEECLPTSA